MVVSNTTAYTWDWYCHLVDDRASLCVFIRWKVSVTSMHLTMFVERWVSYLALFTYLVGWHASAVSLPPGDVILVWLACPLNEIIFCLHQE
jgi:hypothetical protein